MDRGTYLSNRLTFQVFLKEAWKHLRLPPPTPIQLDIADYIGDPQKSPRRAIVEAFRGVGKSYITSAYVCYRLLLNPDIKCLVVSASKVRADDFSTFTQRLIKEMPILEELIPREGQRDSKISFDVGPTKAAHAPSVKSIGITGQLSGSRADLIIADDIEIPSNSQTQMMREKLGESIKEFDAVLSPGGQVIFLGTPQCEQTIYDVLPSRGYEMRIWTARFPLEAQRDKYLGRISPFINEMVDKAGMKPGEPTDPLRFSQEDLIERELSYGKSGFALQFMLDTSLSDMDRYPLKISDLMVMDLNTDTAPETLVFQRAPYLQNDEIPMVGLHGDKWYRPLDIGGKWIPYEGSVLAVDPSGRGRDETSWCVVKMLGGNLFLVAQGGIQGGYSDEVMEMLCKQAKNHKVNLVLIESNFGDGMFQALLEPHLKKIYPVGIEEVRHQTQKEKRIIDTLEPVMNQHRLIIDTQVVVNDFQSTQHLPPEAALAYQLFYQMTRITKDRGSLRHDDRLDCLAMGVRYWVDRMNVEQQEAQSLRREEEVDQMLEDFLEGVSLVTGKPQSHILN